ncbi:MAG: hypothetical protein O2930_15420 [Acidobacteria bacterium]|nr:hypothetical protein [Acidobacteriota bacterium]
MHRTPTLLLSSAMVLVLAATSCGGSDSGSSTPSSPTPTPSPTTTPSTGATITITSSGVSPQSVTVAAGSRVTFVNNDSRVHDMNSDPHPEHTDCQELNQVGFLAAGQTKQTGNLTTVRTCGFHDHNQSTNTSLQGTIVIQ